MFSPEWLLNRKGKKSSRVIYDRLVSRTCAPLNQSVVGRRTSPPHARFQERPDKLNWDLHLLGILALLDQQRLMSECWRPHHGVLMSKPEYTKLCLPLELYCFSSKLVLWRNLRLQDRNVIKRSVLVINRYIAVQWYLVFESKTVTKLFCFQFGSLREMIQRNTFVGIIKHKLNFL